MAALARDKKRRFHGLRRVAQRFTSAAEPDERKMLDTYAAGANAGLRALAARPFEYLLLGQTPEPWRPEDTMLAIFAMWLKLTDEDGNRDLSLTRLYSALPPVMYHYLSQNGSELDAAMDGSQWSPLPLPDATEYNARKLGEALASVVPTGIPNDADVEGLQGSNNWAVTGARSKHGGAIVANDMHLALRIPNIWFRARLVVEQELDLVGVTLPGAPGVVAGSNGHIAWGFTNANADVTDLVEVELNPNNPREYVTRDGYRVFTIRTERFDVADGETAAMAVDETLWGPVRKADGKLYAVQWMARLPGSVDLGLMGFEYLKSVDEAVHHAARVGIPPQNLAVVDKRGNAAWTLAGALPRGDASLDRRRAIPPRRAAPMQRLAPSDTPRIVNPADGNIYSANGRVVSDTAYPGLGDGSYSLGVRQAQIRDGLHAREKLDEADMLAIQLDDRALFMERWRDVLVNVIHADSATGDIRYEKLRGVLPTWSGRAAPADVAYRWVREFRTSVHDLILEGLLVEVMHKYPQFRFVRMRQLEALVWQILKERPMHLLHRRYQSYDELLLAAVVHCMERVARNTPGSIETRMFAEYNSGPITHPLARVAPPLAWLLNMPAYPMPGDTFVPRVARKAGGASERFAVSPGREALGYFHMPGGQSGHPLSPYYRAGHMAWVRGEATPLLPGATQHTLVLKPD